MNGHLPSDSEAVHGTRDWPHAPHHAPPHRLSDAGVYFVTARTRHQTHLFHTSERRDRFQQLLFDVFTEHSWHLEAWAVLSNQYHVIGHSPKGGARTLKPIIQKLHSLATKRLNTEDDAPNRTRLWQNYRETHLTYQHRYLAQLNDVHQNPRHHGLVLQSSQWPWCSAGAFKATASPSWVKPIASFPFDEIAAEDGD
jgi:putative transposase